jgi:hypothetical protein
MLTLEKNVLETINHVVEHQRFDIQASTLENNKKNIITNHEHNYMFNQSILYMKQLVI